MPRADEDALVEAVLRVLGDRALAARLGKAARGGTGLDYTPDEFALSLRQLAEQTIAAGREAS